MEELIVSFSKLFLEQIIFGLLGGKQRREYGDDPHQTCGRG